MFSSDKWFGAEAGFYNGVATQSLRFDSTSNAYLNWTPSSVGNRRTFTFSAWIKRGVLDAQNTTGSSDTSIFSAGSGSGAIDVLRFNSQLVSDKNDLQIYTYDGSADYSEETSASFRDTSSWYHIVFSVDTTQSTASNRIRYYVNGTELTSKGQYYAQVPQNYDLNINNNVIQGIGRNVNETRYFDGYMAEINFVDGTQYDASYFGETKNGIWIAKSPSVTYGTNGFRLQFKQTGTGTASSSTIGADTSGNNNHFTSNNLSAHDVVPDSPENNFATLNPLDPFSGTLSEGNLKYANTNSFRASRGNFEIPSSGKWYFEVLNTTATDGDNAIWAGVAHQDTNISAQPNNGSTTKFYGLYNDSSLGILSNGSQSSYTTNQISANGIIQVAVDTDDDKLYVGINNSYYTNATTSASFNASNSTQNIDLSGYRPFVGAYQNTGVLNSGQDSSFAGAVTAQGNTDANGKGDFYYAPPSGYLALCTSNLPELTIGPNSATQADDHFNTVLYTGNGGSQSITGVGFQPDWTWIKSRSNAFDHVLTDSSRGAEKELKSNKTIAEAQDSGKGLTSFNSDGFSLVLGTSTSYNNNSVTYVGWNWKANGGTTSSNSDGSITSTVQANTTSGFSIVTYTGNATSGATVGHGLGVAPKIVIHKNRDASQDWQFRTTAIDGSHDILNLSNTNTKSDSARNAPTSTVFSLGSGAIENGNGNDFVAYVFAEVEGYSKFGSYTGNGNADGAFVFTGFRPAYVMVKLTSGSGENWHIFDNKRATFNVMKARLIADDSTAENSNDSILDFTSNGFKFRENNAGWNGNGNTYIYMAFAEAPFKYANAR